MDANDEPVGAFAKRFGADNNERQVQRLAEIAVTGYFEGAFFERMEPQLPDTFALDQQPILAPAWEKIVGSFSNEFRPGVACHAVARSLRGQAVNVHFHGCAERYRVTAACEHAWELTMRTMQRGA